MVQEVQLVDKGVAPGLPWFTPALEGGTFQHVYCLINLAVAVSCTAVLLLGCLLVPVMGCDCAVLSCPLQ